MKVRFQDNKGSIISSGRIEGTGARQLPPGLGVRQSSAAFRARDAFTLLEVMIAMGIFFMCIFAILEVVATNLRAARKLQDQPVDVSLLVADLYQTNKLEEGGDSDDFGDLFPGYKWENQITLMSTNGLFKVEYLVTHPGGSEHDEQRMTVLLWRPDSPQRTP